MLRLDSILEGADVARGTPAAAHTRVRVAGANDVVRIFVADGAVLAYGSEVAAERLQQQNYLCRVLWLAGCPVVQFVFMTLQVYSQVNASQVTVYMSHVTCGATPEPC